MFQMQTIYAYSAKTIDMLEIQVLSVSGQHWPAPELSSLTDYDQETACNRWQLVSAADQTDCPAANDVHTIKRPSKGSMRILIYLGSIVKFLELALITLNTLFQMKSIITLACEKKPAIWPLFGCAPGNGLYRYHSPRVWFSIFYFGSIVTNILRLFKYFNAARFPGQTSADQNEKRTTYGSGGV